MKESNWIEIAKYLSGEMNDEEEKKFKLWLQRDASNIEIYNKVKMDWENFDGLSNDVDTDKAWNILKTRLIDEGLFSDTKVYSLKKAIKTSISVAAIIVVLLVAGFLLNDIFQSNQNVVQTAQGEIQVVQLPDGSVVTLNQNSKLKYNTNFIAKTRNVKLEGEAFFEVTKNSEAPFIVQTKTASVTVLGTSFNVSTIIENNNIEVFVKTGKVQLTSDLNKKATVYLEPGEIGCCTKGKVEKRKSVNENYIAWKTHDMVFKNTSLNEVINVIEKVYHVDVEYDKEELSDLNITTSFNDQPLETVLNVISKTFNLQISKKKNKVYLEKIK